MSAIILPTIPREFPRRHLNNILVLFGYFSKWECGSIALNIIRARILIIKFFVRVNICILIPVFPKSIKRCVIMGGYASGLLGKGLGMPGRIE